MAMKHPQEQGAHQEEAWCHQGPPHGSQDAVAGPADSSPCSEPQKILQTQRQLDFPVTRQLSPPSCQLQPLILSLEFLMQNASAAPLEPLSDTARHWEVCPQLSLQAEQLRLSQAVSTGELLPSAAWWPPLDLHQQFHGLTLGTPELQSLLQVRPCLSRLIPRRVRIHVRPVTPSCWNWAGLVLPQDHQSDPHASQQPDPIPWASLPMETRVLHGPPAVWQRGCPCHPLPWPGRGSIRPC